MISLTSADCISLQLFTDSTLNLDILLIQLQSEATSLWYQLGQELGLEISLLNKYCNYPQEQCIIEVLDSWLRNHSGKPTWREIAEALKNIGLQQLAVKIEMIYETGILCIIKGIT